MVTDSQHQSQFKLKIEKADIAMFIRVPAPCIGLAQSEQYKDQRRSKGNVNFKPIEAGDDVKSASWFENDFSGMSKAAVSICQPGGCKLAIAAVLINRQ